MTYTEIVEEVDKAVQVGEQHAREDPDVEAPSPWAAQKARSVLIQAADRKLKHDRVVHDVNGGLSIYFKCSGSPHISVHLDNSETVLVSSAHYTKQSDGRSGLKGIYISDTVTPEIAVMLVQAIMRHIEITEDK